MRRKQKFHLVMLGAAGLVLALAFNNCGRGRSLDQASSFLPTSPYNSADACTEKEIDVFARGYHEFLKNQCKNCHISGPGKGTFASPDVQTAFDGGFKVIGYDKISQFAVSDAHNPPYTGSQNGEIVNLLRLQWTQYQKDKAACADGSTNSPVSDVFTPQFETSVKAIPQITSTQETVTVGGVAKTFKVFSRQTLTWDLNKDLASISSKPLPNLNGVSLSMTVTGFEIASGQSAYLFTLPILKVGTNSIHVQGLNFRLNGFPIQYATTFKKLNQNIYLSTSKLLAPGSLVSVGALGPNDTLSIQLGNIEVTSLAAPPPPPTVSFKLAAMNITSAQQGYANKVTVEVQISGGRDEPVSVSVNTTDAANYLAGEIPAMGILGAGQNRFDWDFKIDPLTSTSLNFGVTDTVKTFNVIFSDDLRNDPGKVLRLELATPFGAVVGANRVLKMTLPSYTAAPTSAPTFSLLMNPASGVLGRNCVKCHNSVQRQGGYDMTDYQDMVNRGIIVPGDTTASDHKMFRRMNANDPNLQGLQSMPLDGFLPRDQVDLVNDWIMDGAKNN